MPGYLKGDIVLTPFHFSTARASWWTFGSAPIPKR